MEEERKKVVMIGPVYPYKGGISHYTGMMYRTLSKKYDVEMISYKMQYPKILFKKEQKDYNNETFRIKETKFLINTANPINILSVSLYIKKMRPHLVIFQWWHPYFSPCYWLMTKIMGKRIKTLFVCHNVFPHERFPMDKLLCKLALHNVDYYITQSSMDTEDLKKIRSNPVYTQTVHPTYNMFNMKKMNEQTARRLLKIHNNENVLLFFGFVREYKGLKHLISAMPEIVNVISNARLLIVGDFAGDKDVYQKLIQDKKVEGYIHIYDGYIPDDEVEKYFAASDVVVLPYESATQSGIVQIAYGFFKPVIVTNVGGLPDVVEDGKTGYIVERNNEHQLAEAVIKYFNQNKKSDFSKNIKEEEYKYSWDKMNDIISEMCDI